MIYKKFKDLSLSALGFGCMRFPIIEDDYSTIDEELAAKMIDYAMKSGVNYYDTAWGYHNGMSETVLGRILAKYPRESFYLASKFPGYDLANMGKVEEIFEEQLKKCGVEYFDFYLFHNVCEANIDGYLDEKYGIYEYLMKQKANGRIRHLGFSAHGSQEVIERFLQKYGESMEFGQLQINYLDWIFQNGKEKVEQLTRYGIPVWVMEPVRGGRLAKLRPEEEAKLRALRPEESMPSWAFRFLQGIPEVTMILSGMSDFNQVKENIETFKEEKPLNDKEQKVIEDLAREMISKSTLPCTACRYCTDHCPKGLDIPVIISLYNEHRFTGGGFIAPMYLSSIAEDHWPNACIGCHSCEKVCPQQIQIAEMMKDFNRRLK